MTLLLRLANPVKEGNPALMDKPSRTVLYGFQKGTTEKARIGTQKRERDI